MVDYKDSSQLHLWRYTSPDELNLCRALANQKAREFLSSLSSTSPSSATGPSTPSSSSAAAAAAAAATDSSTTEQQQTAASSTNKQDPPPLPVEKFACGFSERILRGEQQQQQELKSFDECDKNKKGHPFLTPEDEAVLVTFYVSKLGKLIGPSAQVPRLRRESKVPATAALLLRRFYLSNSVMLHDPKATMVAAAFLASKVEDATADVRNLEEGTARMDAAVRSQEIIPAELNLLNATHFDLVCFHPYKAVQALTEDLRTYLKSDKGKVLVKVERPLSGQDLKPMYDAARKLLDDAVVSDIPLLYSPGQVGLASLMVAQDIILRTPPQHDENQQQQSRPPQIDFLGYVRQRFENGLASGEWMEETLQELCAILKALREGKYGCGNYGTDMQALKRAHKKLKKVRVWGRSSSKDKGSSKKKKRSAGTDGEQPEAKRKKAS